MRTRCLLALFGILGTFTAGCDGSKPPQAPAAKAPAAPVAAAPAESPKSATNVVQFHLNRALPKLPTVRLWVGPKEIDAEMCLTLQQIATGLMFRPGIADGESMLFVLPQPQQTHFYMRNVTFDIDAAYIDSEGVIQEVVRLKKLDETPVPSKSDNIQFVLETAPGWFERNGIKPGTLIRSTKRSLREEFGFN
jgi:uncharacterized membrane protein (UPF0127 family)